MGHSDAIVKKKDGSFRMCIDYRQLNKVSIRTSIISLGLMICLINSKVKAAIQNIDSRSGYHQHRVRGEDIKQISELGVVIISF